MRILYVSQYYPPEVGAPAARVSELGREWVRAGHRVTVLTGFPNHPTGERYPGFDYGNRVAAVEWRDGIRVVRTYLHFAANAKVWRRGLNYGSFMLSAAARGALLREGYDVLIATSPQMLVPVAGRFAAHRLGIPWVLEVRDIWPEGIAIHGVLTHPTVYRPLKRLMLGMYRDCDLLVGVTPAFEQAFVDDGVPRDKIAIVTNGVDTERFAPGERDNRFRARLGLGDDFLVTYVGTHGHSQGLDAVVRAAARLTDLPHVRFVFVGEGAMKGSLAALAGELGLDGKVLLLPKHDRDWMPDIYNASDVCVVHLKDIPLYDNTIPSKIFEILGCGRPLVAGVRRQARQLIEDDCGSGLCVRPEDDAAIADAVRRLHDDPKLAQRLGEAGHGAVRERYSRRATAEAYLGHLERAIGRGRR